MSLPAVALVPLLLFAGDCEFKLAAPPADTPAAAQPSPKSTPSAKTPPPKTTDPTPQPRTQRTVTGQQWYGFTENAADRYWLELATGKYTSVDVPVSKAVYMACDLGEMYPRCAEGAGS